MQTLIQKEAQTYAKWASLPHQTAVVNQHSAQWARWYMLDVACTPEARRNMLKHRIHVSAMVTESLMRRDGLIGPSDVRGMIGRTILVRVTK